MPGTAAPAPGNLSGFHARVLDEAPPPAPTRDAESDGGIVGSLADRARDDRPVSVHLDRVPKELVPLLQREWRGLAGRMSVVREGAAGAGATTSLILTATGRAYREVLPRLRASPAGLSDVANSVSQALAHRFGRPARPLPGLRHPITLGGRTLIMGVVNVTPDSFSDGGRFLDPDAAARQARTLVEEGADLIDIGGESTRPGAVGLDPTAEWERLGPVLERLGTGLPVPISIDTRHAEVAERALEHGAEIINDVGGLREPSMRALLSRTQAPAIVMHMRGDPTTMRSNLVYDDLRGEVYAALADACERVRSEGVHMDRLLIDPGLGFGKSPAQDFELLDHLAEFRSLGAPIVVGASRKSFLGWALGGAPAAERLEASLAAAVAASLRGADIVRVHDVQPTVRALRIADRFRREYGAQGSPP
ncbi:MAG TPA: dihydropteroate synthase [Thermoplasmata archaeon]|nr:dihydropteroate synthase [Thermoplasmata archaeon]